MRQSPDLEINRQVDDLIANDKPLIVDLDQTLVKTDLLYESFANTVGLGLGHQIRAVAALLRGKAPLKAYLANHSRIDYTKLPYDENVIALINEVKADGRKVYLASACDLVHARAINQHLGLFDGVFASDGVINLSGSAKADAIVAAFGEKNFDYVGNSKADIPVWRKARVCYAIRLPDSIYKALLQNGLSIQRLEAQGITVKNWLRAIRVHQYAKNVLVFVALVTSHSFTLAAFGKAALAFAAFSLAASAIYLINDLVDLESDRRHPRKRLRPFASGDLPINHAGLAVGLLLIGAMSLALMLSLKFVAILAFYLILTSAYSFSLKRKMLVDAVVLAMLYTIRVIGGAAAIDVAVSEWLLAFSMFIFLSLALIKRYTELTVVLDNKLPDPLNRNYKAGDLPIVSALAAASGFNAVTVFTLYAASPQMRDMYRHPELIWIISPVIAYWIARAIMIAHRRTMNDDPIVFAIKDRVSQIAFVLILAIVGAAI